MKAQIVSVFIDGEPVDGLFLPVTLDEDGEPVVHGAKTSVRWRGLASRPGDCVDFLMGLLTLARQAKEDK